MQSNATTVLAYVKSLPAERRKELELVRNVVLKNLPKGYQEVMQYGMITYIVPETVLPAEEVYNKKPLGYVGLAAQKHYLAIYLDVYSDPKVRRWFMREYKASGKKLDIGKSCVRFKKAQDLPLELIANVVARTPLKEYVASYHASRQQQKRRPVGRKK
jgi:uncharacterized protein YdhG (YjbR/CyaY superfamily)